MNEAIKHQEEGINLSPEEADLLHNNHWYAVHSKSRHEKISSKLIMARGIEIYLPVRKLRRKWSDRTKIIEFPLFKGYFFVNMSLSIKNAVLSTKGIVRLLGTIGPEPIPAEQIETLKIFETQEIEIDPYPQLVSGSRVKVVRGPLRGSIGQLDQKRSGYRLVIMLQVLRQAVSVEIDVADIEPVV